MTEYDVFYVKIRNKLQLSMMMVPVSSSFKLIIKKMYIFAWNFRLACHHLIADNNRHE